MSKSKKLSEMTLEELWRLFPIELVPHDAKWSEQFAREKTVLAQFFPSARISHIGSTAVKGIYAKPIVDILLETDCVFLDVRALLEQNGWICMSESQTRLSFNKGYRPQGFAEEVFHLHVRRFGDCDEVYFCRYLNANPHVAKEYEKLKLQLWKKFEFNRDAYTDAKTEFVQKYTSIAKNGAFKF